MNNVLVVSNFNAGRKKALMHKKTLMKFLLANCEKFRFVSIDEFSELNIDEFDTIIVIGGDGTVNKVASKIIGTDKALVIIPSGTANLLAANLCIPFNLKKNLKRLKQKNIKVIDVIDVNGACCVLRTGFGYDSDIICKTVQSIKNKFGYFAYFIAGIIFALRLKKKTYEIEINDGTKQIDATCLIVANAANMYRNIISVGNNSKVDDGIFEVFILKTQNPIIFFIEFLFIILGLRRNNSRAEYYKTDKLTVKNNWCVSHVDGEKRILKGDINIKLLPNKLRVYY